MAGGNPDDEWQQLMQEAEALEQLLLEWELQPSTPATAPTAAAPEVPLPKLPELPGAMVFASVSIGTGFSDNYLRRHHAQSSWFQRLEADFFYLRTFRLWHLQAFAYAEGVFYAAGEQPAEGLAIAQLELKRQAREMAWGTQISVYAADQLYDASLIITGAPEADRIQQFRPELLLFIDRPIASGGELHVEAASRYSFYDQSNNNVARHRIQAAYRHALLPHLDARFSLDSYQDHYHRRPARQARGLPLPNSILTIQGHTAAADLRWRPAFLPASTLTIAAGRTWERDATGLYDANQRWFGQIRLNYRTQRWLFQTHASAQRQTFSYRHASFTDPRPQVQQLHVIGGQIRYSISKSWQVRLDTEWESYQSRNPIDKYRQLRTQILLQWNF